MGLFRLRRFRQLWFVGLVVLTCLALEILCEVQVDASGEFSEGDELMCEEWVNSGECDRNQDHHCAVVCSVIGTKQTPDIRTTKEIALSSILDSVGAALDRKLDSLLVGTFTDKCRDEVAEAMTEHLVRYINEQPAPFQSYEFSSQCPRSEQLLHLPPPHADDVRICYLLLIHENAQQAIRLINSLQEPMHTFLIHVDGKASEALLFRISEYIKSQPNVAMVTDRVNITWGGHHMVKATLNGMAEALKLELEFDWLCNLSGASYPLVNNGAIRRKLSELHSSQTTMMEINPQPSEPSEAAWNYFVECDNKLRRIGPLKPPRGIKMYVGSQWFFAAKPFVQWLVSDKSLVARYAEYSAHTVVADENFFATLFKNSPFCHEHVNSNMLHVQFDQWEHDKQTHKQGRVNDKCLSPNPDVCGRSPTVISVESLPVLELSEMLWARKFDERVDDKILDALDVIRREGHQQGAHFERVRAKQLFDGHEVCLTIGRKQGDAVTMRPCSSNKAQALEVGTCSSDGSIILNSSSSYMQVSKGRFSIPFCPIRSVGAPNNCLDLEGESVNPGTLMIGWGCSKKWNQLFSFGSEELSGSIFLNVPLELYQDKRVCLEALEAKVGTKVTIRDCDPSSSLQRFKFDPA